MSKLWDDLKENMKEWSVSAVEKAEEMSRIAMAKTEEITRISKIKFEIHQLQREMEQNYLKLGKLTYSHTKEDHMATFSGNTEFFRIVERVDDVKKEIAAKEKEIEKIKEEYGISDEEVQGAVPSINEGMNQNADEEEYPKDILDEEKIKSHSSS